MIRQLSHDPLLSRCIRCAWIGAFCAAAIPIIPSVALAVRVLVLGMSEASAGEVLNFSVVACLPGGLFGAFSGLAGGVIGGFVGFVSGLFALLTPRLSVTAEFSYIVAGLGGTSVGVIALNSLIDMAIRILT